MDADEAEALDRNWNELLQELRVTQTGLQILTGFLVTLPFQQRFTQLDTFERGVYLGALAVAVSATVLVTWLLFALSLPVASRAVTW